VIGPHGHARFGQAELAIIATAVREMIRLGWSPVAFAMHPSDEDALLRVLRAAGVPAARVSRPASGAALMDLLAECTAVVSMRLHGSVLGCCVGVPPIVISYLEKCRDFALSMELDEYVLDIGSVTTSQIVERLERVAGGGEPLRTDILHRAHGWRETLERYFREIRRTLAADGGPGGN